ncbi:MAG: 3-keto-5-aminohexanoate cleavage protein [Opitutaceae bacterium]|nr:3-keto-5-aminohexanoate cleavage protein [Opitutaceae bacterium]
MPPPAPAPSTVAIAVAPNGGRRLKKDHPAVPLTAMEMARTAAACLEAGAAMLHMHVRDSNGRHLLDAEAYAEALAVVRAATGRKLFLQITTESLGTYRPREQMAVVRSVRPEGVSLALRELVPSAAAESAFAKFLGWLKSAQIMPQFILYNPAELDRLDELCRRGLVPWEEPPVLIVLGRYTLGQTSAPEDLAPFFSAGHRRFAHTMVCAFGRNEAACAVAGAQAGADVRVGFENNLHLPDGRIAADNAALVRATARALIADGHKLASAEQLRARWELQR